MGTKLAVDSSSKHETTHSPCGILMKKMLFAAAGLVIALALACSSATPFSTANPTATTVPAVTPVPVQGWELARSRPMGPQSGPLYVYAGVDVDVAINGNPPSRVDATVPILELVFGGLAASEHPVLISDVIGHSESASVMIVEPLPDKHEAPDWLAGDMGGRPGRRSRGISASVHHRIRIPRRDRLLRAQGKLRPVQRLLGADGKLIGHPDGGITGRGDGFTVFSPENLKGEEVWLGH